MAFFSEKNIHHACIACITIDSAFKMDEKYFPQVYLEECKYKINEKWMSRFINAELKSDSDDDSYSDSDDFDDDSGDDSEDDSDDGK